VNRLAKSLINPDFCLKFTLVRFQIILPFDLITISLLPVCWMNFLIWSDQTDGLDVSEDGRAFRELVRKKYEI
jgi:hypothetical protein